MKPTLKDIEDNYERVLLRLHSGELAGIVDNNTHQLQVLRKTHWIDEAITTADLDNSYNGTYSTTDFNIDAIAFLGNKSLVNDAILYGRDEIIDWDWDINNPHNLKFKKGDTDFLAYVTLGNVNSTEIGAIKQVSDLVLSSKYCKVINNQLVLYGNHGYMFFSEFDNFYYFPNYNNVYAAETENESIVGISYFRQYYALFTNKRIKRMSGAFGSDDFGIYPLNDFIGCINPRSIRQIQNYIYFLSYNGIYILKQGYLGEGTENVEQLDLPIYRSYDSDSMLKGYTIQNYYALYSKKDAILYNFTNDAFYKLKTADVDEEDTNILKVNETKYSTRRI